MFPHNGAFPICNRVGRIEGKAELCGFFHNKNSFNMKYYLILDKTNRVVRSFTNKEEAESYVKARPYLKVLEFDDSPDTSSVSNVHHAVTDDLPF